MYFPVFPDAPTMQTFIARAPVRQNGYLGSTLTTTPTTGHRCREPHRRHRLPRDPRECRLLQVAEAGLGFGSLFFCDLLFRTGLVPRFLAVWGFIGYACFVGGALLELFGVAGAGLVGAIPGGLFELTFGIWLIARGVASTATVRSGAST